MAAPGSITLIPDVISAADGTYTEASVTIPGSPYIYKLGAGLPIPYPSGAQVIPPQGVSNAVTISGGGYGSWTQVSSAPGLGQFTVDTSISPTGGQIGFNSGDAGKVVSITYLANTYVNKVWFEFFVTALRDIRDWRGVAGGLAAIDSSGNLVLPANGKVAAPGQTGGVANQGIGTATIPSGTANNALLTFANTKVTANSLFVFTVSGSDTHILSVVGVAVTAGTSFQVRVKTDGANTGSDCTLTYLIIN